MFAQVRCPLPLPELLQTPLLLLKVFTDPSLLPELSNPTPSLLETPFCDLRTPENFSEVRGPRGSIPIIQDPSDLLFASYTLAKFSLLPGVLIGLSLLVRVTCQLLLADSFSLLPEGLPESSLLLEISAVAGQRFSVCACSHVCPVPVHVSVLRGWGPEFKLGSILLVDTTYSTSIPAP